MLPPHANLDQVKGGLVLIEGKRTAALSGANAFRKGFTLIELMVVLANIAKLAAIALPEYSRYVKKIRARSAGPDLVALSLNLENTYQRKLRFNLRRPLLLARVVITQRARRCLASAHAPCPSTFQAFCRAK